MPQKKYLVLVYLASFLYSFHYALPIYIESSFIAQFISHVRVATQSNEIK